MKVLNWENDLIEEPEQAIVDYCNTHCKNLEFEMMSGLKYRMPEEIIDSIRTGVSKVVMNPNLMDSNQIRSIVSLIGKGMYGYVFAEDVDEFVFINHSPKEIAETIINACKNKWDEDANNPRNALTAILNRSRCFCVGLEGEKYEITSTGWRTREFEIIELDSSK